MAWNQNKDLQSSPRQTPSRTLRMNGRAKGLIAALVVVVGACAWLLSHLGDSNEPAEKRQTSKKQIAQVQPAAAPKAVIETNIVDKTAPHPGYRQPTNPNLPRKKYIPTIEEIEKARLGKDGKPRKMSIYKTPLEQALGILFTTKLGSPPPMLPSIPAISSPEMLQKFFNTAMEYDKDASKAVNENRILMQQVKDELKKYLDEGGTPNGFVEYYQNELRAAHDEWKTAQKMLIEMSRSGESAEKMRNFRDKANEILGKRGIKPLAVPPFVRESMNEL